VRGAADARRFWDALRVRLEEFALSLQARTGKPCVVRASY
jgi:hypothetical protein